MRFIFNSMLHLTFYYPSQLLVLLFLFMLLIFSILWRFFFKVGGQVIQTDLSPDSSPHFCWSKFILKPYPIFVLGRFLEVVHHHSGQGKCAILSLNPVPMMDP